jgi:hypothetical protein
MWIEKHRKIYQGGERRMAMGASGTVVPARYTRRASARDQYA